MYTNNDLNMGIEEGIFTKESVTEFRELVARKKELSVADEENFRLVSGFNDIFVVVASVLLLTSVGAIFSDSGSVARGIAVALVSWGLAEFFVRRRKMALPAIVLLFPFVGGIFSMFMDTHVYLENVDDGEAIQFAAGALAATLAAYLHWRRFAVPITVALGAVVAMIFCVATIGYFYPDLKDYIAYIVFVFGVVAFVLAMYFDTADVKRMTRHSDAAFWLHLLASPLIVHSLFLGNDFFDGSFAFGDVMLVVMAYFVLSLISLIIDRRAFMISSLVYVLYALNKMFESYGFEGNSFAIGGAIIGLSLLLLTAFWVKSRVFVLRFMPDMIRSIVPAAEYKKEK